MSLIQDADPDLSTQSNYQDIFTTSAHFDWTIDFDAKKISGFVELTLTVKKTDVSKLILDTSELDIKPVGAITVDEKKTTYQLLKPSPVLGAPLCIDLSPGFKPNDSLKVKIEYSTKSADETTKDVALQWLAKELTVGKKHPYLFSQCQMIYARSLAPLQDTCAVKFTYTANISSKYPVLMSAPNRDRKHDGKKIGTDIIKYNFEQSNPIPSYLLAIAVGNVEYKAFKVPNSKTWTSGVWTEHGFLDRAYNEFCDDIPKYLADEEEIMGDYKWKVYDILVLPPSFPYGGMENPCMTFVTPALVVGDRSLVDVGVHELTHSWFGNGVTCTWAKHFWLNEGWTIYMERVLQERLRGTERRGLFYIIGKKELDTDWAAYGKNARTLKYRKLVIDYTEKDDPDDGFSTIPYEKGGNFIFYLEKLLGGLEKFLPYAKAYADKYWGKSITTDEWKSNLQEYFKDDKEALEALKEVKWEAWLEGTEEQDKLPVDMKWNDGLAKPAWNLASNWNNCRGLSIPELPFKATDLDGFDANQTLIFLDSFSLYYEPLPSYLIVYLGTLYHFISSNNVEIRYRFYLLALAVPESEAAKLFAVEAAKWVVGTDGTWVQGRMKYCRPIFTAINKVNSKLAKDTFDSYGKYFHPIAQKNIKSDNGWA